MRIGLLSNLRAGRNDKHLGRLLNSLHDLPEVQHIETSDAEAVPEALRNFARQDVDILAVNGGDGTLQTVLTEILGNGAFDERVPMIAPLRGGRTNMTCLDLETRRDSLCAIADLVLAGRRGLIHERVVERPVLRIEHGIQRSVDYGMFFGAGATPRAIDLVQNVFPKGRAQGVFGGGVVAAGLLARIAAGKDRCEILDPDKASLLLDRDPVPGDHFRVLMSCTLDRLFLGLRPFWGEGKGNVRFTAIDAEAQNFGRALPGILRGRPGITVDESTGYTSRNVNRAEIRMDCGFTVDGEIIREVPGGMLTLTAEDVVPFLRA